MKKFKQLSTFWQMSILTFLVIVSIITIILTAQLAEVRIWTIEYEKDNIESKYEEISMIINTNSNINYKELFDAMDLDIIIYNQDKHIIYNTVDEIPKNLEFDNTKRIKYKVILNFEYDNIILNAPLNVKDQQHNIYLLNKTELFEDYLEATVNIMIFLII